MTYRLEFSTLLKIALDENGLIVPLTISAPIKDRQIQAYFDSGATYTVLPRWLGDDLGFDVESGTPTNLRTGSGVMQTYLHYTTFFLGELSFGDVPVCIAKYHDFNRCLLGREGWLQAVRFGLVTYDNQMYLSLYDE